MKTFYLLHYFTDNVVNTNTMIFTLHKISHYFSCTIFISTAKNHRGAQAIPKHKTDFFFFFTNGQAVPSDPRCLRRAVPDQAPHEGGGVRAGHQDPGSDAAQGAAAGARG